MNIDKLAPELRELAIQRTKDQDKEFRLKAGEKLIGNLFNWSETPEGHSFWSRVHNREDMTSHRSYPKCETYQIF